MTEKNGHPPITKTVFDRIFSAGATVTGLYDHSLTSRLVGAVRLGLLTLYSKIIGVFFLTFGIYSFLIALLILLFTERSVDSSSLYGGALCAVCSLPLLFSKGNVSTILTQSAVGDVICDHLNIRRDDLEKSSFSGQVSIAFVAGVALGAVTLIYPFGSIMAAIAFVFMLYVILSSPEAGLTFMTVLLFITDIKLQYAVIAVTALSYIIKLIRRKRRLCLKKTDSFLFIFAVATTGAAVFTTEDSTVEGCGGYIVLLAAYFLGICLMRDARKIIKLFKLATVTCGILSALYILGVAVEVLLPRATVVDRGYLFELISSLPAFSQDLAPIAMAALIPVCVSFIIKSRSEGSRFTFCLCLAAMATCLLISEKLAFLLAAVTVSALVLIITGSRWVYLALSSLLAIAVALLFAGTFGDSLYGYMTAQLSEAYDRIKDLPLPTFTFYNYSFSGQGFTEYASAQKSFYASIMSQLGIAGVIIFSVFIIFVLCEAASLIIKTHRAAAFEEASRRFKGMDSPSEMRLCMIALSCSLLVLLICAAFCNFYESRLSYLLLFMICGAVCAYARCAKAEIAKAEDSLEASDTEENSSTVLKKTAQKG